MLAIEPRIPLNSAGIYLYVFGDRISLLESGSLQIALRKFPFAEKLLWSIIIFCTLNIYNYIINQYVSILGIIIISYFHTSDSDTK